MVESNELAMSHSEEEYLEAVYKLTQNGQPAPTNEIAASLGVSAPAASSMVRHLASHGAITFEPYGGARLTEKGRKEALKVVRRHRLLERLLTDVLKLPWDSVHEQACQLEHSILPATEAKIEEALGFVDTCPHGHPIPTADGEVAAQAATPLAEVPSGRRARVVRIASEASDFLRYLASLGLFPGVEVLVETKAPFHGPVMIKVGDARYALGEDVAASILVSPA